MKRSVMRVRDDTKVARRVLSNLTEEEKAWPQIVNAITDFEEHVIKIATGPRRKIFVAVESPVPSPPPFAFSTKAAHAFFLTPT